MLDAPELDSVAKKLFSSLPLSIQNLEKELQQKFKDILQASLARLDLVTREEFDIQTRVLARTREKVEKIEQQLQDFITQKKS